MTGLEDLALVMVIVVVIQGIWLIGLTYFMWKRHLRLKQEKKQPTQTEKA